MDKCGVVCVPLSLVVLYNDTVSRTTTCVCDVDLVMLYNDTVSRTTTCVCDVDLVMFY